MASPIPSATITALLTARFSDKRMIDLTNQDNASATVINPISLGASVADAEEIFNVMTGDDSSDEYGHDLGALKYMAMYYLYIYAGDDEYATMYLTLGQIFLEQALMSRLNVKMTTPADQRPQEFTLRQQMIQSIPRPA